MKKCFTLTVFLSALSLSSIFLGALSSTNAMEPVSQSQDKAFFKASFEDFKVQTDVFMSMRPGQQAALKAIWEQYGDITTDNRDLFFSQLDGLANKWRDRGGNLRNGQILGQHAKDTKSYIDQVLAGLNVSNDFKDTYDSAANAFGARMQDLKSKQEIIQWATQNAIFKINGETRCLTHSEASNVYDGIINGDFI